MNKFELPPFHQQVQSLIADWRDPRHDVEPITPPAIPDGRRRRAKSLSTGKVVTPGPQFDIHIPAQACLDHRLSPAAKIVYGKIVGLTKQRGYCWASNQTIAEQCALDRDTVSAAIGSLRRLGYLATEKVKGRRHLLVPDRGNLPHPQTTEIAEAPAENIGGLRKSAEPCAENNRVHLNPNVIKKEDEDKKTSSSSSVIINRRPEDSQSDPGVPPVDHLAAINIVLQWGRQVAGLMGKRLWTKRQHDGSEQPISLGIPAPARPAAKELEQLADVAQEFWPGCEVLQGIRQLLRAAGLTSDKRDKLQQYSYLASGGSLSVRAVLRLGGHEDPQAFLRESTGAVQEPLPAVSPGSSKDAAVMIRLAYDMGPAWDDEVWLPCWAEAAGRCRDLGVEPQLYMAAVFHLYEQQGRNGVVPWIADSLAEAQLQEFLPTYREDRRRAWQGRMGRRDPNDPRLCSQEYSESIGRLTADSAAAGCTRFRNRSCLHCAAAELRLVPELVHDVAWNQSADRLADLLDQLADRTVEDDVPSRGTACGQYDCGTASFIRCLHGNLEGTYVPGYDDLQPDREGKVPPVKVTAELISHTPAPVAAPAAPNPRQVCPEFDQAAFLAGLRKGQPDCERSAGAVPAIATMASGFNPEEFLARIRQKPGVGTAAPGGSI